MEEKRIGFKRKTLLGLSLLVMMYGGFSSCSDDDKTVEPQSEYLNDQDAVRLAVSIRPVDGLVPMDIKNENRGMQTKSNPFGTTDEQYQFNVGDSVSVAADSQTSVIYTLQEDGNWVPQDNRYLKWDAATMAVSAYYPSSATDASANSFSVPVDQSSLEALAKADYMTFQGKVERESGNLINIRMQRRTVRLVIDQIAFGEHLEQGSRVTGIRIHGNTNGYKGGDVQSGDIIVTAYKHTDGKFYAIMTPTTADAESAFMYVTVQKPDGTDMELVYKGIPNTSIGYSYGFSMEVDDKAGLSASDIAVSEWKDKPFSEDWAQEIVSAASLKVSYVQADAYYKGGSLQLTASVLPANVSNKTVNWTSSDEKVATVDATGLVSFLKTGEVTIKATSGDGLAKDSVTFNIVEQKIALTFNKSSLQGLAYGQKVNLKGCVTVTPADMDFSQIKWSDASGLASVDANGMLTVKISGITADLQMKGHTINLVASDGNGVKIDSVDVTVAAGRMLYNFADGVAPFDVSWNSGTTYSQEKKYLHVDVSSSLRQDIRLASTSNKGGFYVSTAKYKYFAVKIRRPYYYDETNGYNGVKHGTANGWKYNKMALNLTPTSVGNIGHVNFSKELDMSGDTPTLTDVKWNGQPKVYVFEFNQAKLLEGTDAATGLVDLKYFDLVIADINESVSEKSYDLYWIGTFDSLEAIKEYYVANE